MADTSRLGTILIVAVICVGALLLVSAAIPAWQEYQRAAGPGGELPLSPSSGISGKDPVSPLLPRESPVKILSLLWVRLLLPRESPVKILSLLWIRLLLPQESPVKILFLLWVRLLLLRTLPRPPAQQSSLRPRLVILFLVPGAAPNPLHSSLFRRTGMQLQHSAMTTPARSRVRFTVPVWMRCFRAVLSGRTMVAADIPAWSGRTRWILPSREILFRWW